jgi:hypothetical protein
VFFAGFRLRSRGRALPPTLQEGLGHAGGRIAGWRASSGESGRPFFLQAAVFSRFAKWQPMSLINVCASMATMHYWNVKYLPSNHLIATDNAHRYEPNQSNYCVLPRTTNADEWEASFSYE